LRVLDGGEYQRLGESSPRRSNFRLVAATNRPESALKHDILARLTFRVQTPDLNTRREDIPLIVRHQMRRLAKHDPDVAREFFGRDPGHEPKLPCALIRALLQHAYTTNVRELSNLLWEVLAKHIDGSQRLNEETGFDFLSSRERPVLPEVSGEGTRPGPRGAYDSWPAPARESSPPSPVTRSSLPAPPPGNSKGFSPEEIQACLDRHNGSIEQAWPELGLSSRYALARLIKKHGLEIRKRKLR
jgi:two-component system nitrogen regulation response regulator GlnG/two-component system response regulator HydG